jgi:predicted ABC-type transport system involved in lysophospholipase L1 biosynthesis ATPase subunit
VRALDDVSLSVEPGEFVSLVGRSAAADNAAELAGAMDFPTSGAVLLDGNRQRGWLTRNSPAFAAKSGSLSFSTAADAHRGREYQLPLQLSDRRTFAQALERLQLSRWKPSLGAITSTPADNCSGDHRPGHRLAAQCPARRAIGNLDSTSAEVVMKLLRRIADETGTAILMATHSLEAAQITDTIVTLRDGRIEDSRAVA